MRRFIFILFCIMISGLLIVSCTKVVDINLNSATPKIIIESGLGDKPGYCTVKLSKSVNYNEPNVFPEVTGATVFVTDNLGNVSTLNETTQGMYTLPLFAGVVGRIYSLTVSSEGKSYVASSEINLPVNIDTLVQDSSIQSGLFGHVSKRRFINVIYHDPAGVSNYYRFVELINGVANDHIIINDDKFNDGNVITRRISINDSSIIKGDTITVLLQSIDKKVFDYLTMFQQLMNSGFGAQTATPANPTSNFDNGALGYFSAYAVRSKSIVLK